MPYEIRKSPRSDKPFLIVRKSDGVIVGRSDDAKKAARSIAYRMAAETKKR